MTRAAPPPFPHAVCWNSTRRAVVLNPIALDVPEEVFRATHHPSLVQQEGAATGSVVTVAEDQLVEDFLSASETHGFTAAVGDTGTGKSHFIRWLYLEILRRAATDHAPCYVVMIPRSAANLADVVRRILQDFDGEATDRLRAEVERHRGLGEPEARQRVLDELAIVVGNMPPAEDEDDEAEYLRETLPAFLRDDAIRRALGSTKEGIVRRLARHVLGDRKSAEPENLRWASEDLVLPVKAIEKAGEDAGELASSLLTDDRLREGATRIIRRAQGPAIAALLRFRSGDLKRALSEIRAQLANQGRELILLLEDLSITEGLDGELLEALQIRTQDTGTRLCTLRSIVGLTREDYQRLRDNIKDRLTLTLWFDAPIGHGTAESENAELAAFSARYLNAVRLDPAELAEWAAGPPGSRPPSACEACPNRGDCHAAFGAVDGLGLYPLTPIAIGRLYRLVVRPADHLRPFKPRSLLKVLRDMLDEAERGMERRDFPTAQVIQSFGLGRTTANLQLALRNEFKSEGDRILRAIELYADQPAIAQPRFHGGIAAAFELPNPTWSSDEQLPIPELPRPSTELPVQPPTPTLDLYDQWHRGSTPTDKAVNAWRQALLEAVQAAIEWDVEGIAHFRSVFRAREIRIEGQKTRTINPVLVVKRTPESVIALRVLSEPAWRQGQDAEAFLRTTRIQIDAWVEEVRHKIEEKASPTPGLDPLQVGVQLLAVGAFVRGDGSRIGKEGPLLDQSLRSDFDTALSRGRGGAWSALLRAYTKLGGKVQHHVHHALSCTKGGQAGPFLDPSPVIQTLRDVRRGELPTFKYDEAADWRSFRDVGRLAQQVAQHLPVALAEERRAAEEWREVMGQRLGEDSPADLLAWITDALEAATETGHGDGSFRRTVAELQKRAVNGCIGAVDKVLSATDEAGRLLALGSLDRPLMKQLADTTEMAERALGEVEARLNQRLNDAHGGRSAAEFETEIQEQLERIEVAYAELLGEEVDHG